jgi:hypothetical protein
VGVNECVTSEVVDAAELQDGQEVLLIVTVKRDGMGNIPQDGRVWVNTHGDYIVPVHPGRLRVMTGLTTGV